ncbi:MAG: hypothetical protein KC620_17785, partial [Myxococcales bacterium]|nr:hypothetical protein [Myxococcales bacterium]
MSIRMACHCLMLTATALGCASRAQETLPTDLRLPPTALAARPALRAGVTALWQGRLNIASQAFNRALEAAPRDPWLHFLNAYAYDLRAEQGELSQAELAEVGYRLALKFDPNQWAAAYRLGRLLWRQGRLGPARDAFARAVVAAPERAVSAYALAVGSYAMGDARTAAWALDRLPPAQVGTPRVLRDKALVKAALGEDHAAAALLADYRTAGGPGADGLASRIDAWKQAYGRSLAQP